MKPRGSTGFHRPFADLSKTLKRCGQHPAGGGVSSRSAGKPAPVPDRPLSPSTERRLFLDAVADVVPLRSCRYCPPPRPVRSSQRPSTSPDISDLSALDDLVQSGVGFVVEQTAEYLEGRQQWVPAEVTRRLHRGRFSVQAFLDLHGLRTVEAAAAVDAFLIESLRRGRRVVLIVHGRGLSSPGKPVLKREVVKWLTCGKWRKWVLAFTSAPLHDGGAGGTYVLMGHRPIPKKRRRLIIQRQG